MTRIRPAGPADVAPVCALLHGKMNPKIPLDRWRAIMEYPWLAEKPDRGWLVEDAGSVVAVIEMVRDGVLPGKGFLRQEDIPLDAFLKTRTGAFYAGGQV